MQSEEKIEALQCFAREYFTNGHDIEAAFRKVWPERDIGNSTAYKEGTEFLKLYIVQKEIDRLSMEAVRNCEDDVVRIMQEIKTSAFLDPGDFFDSRGNVRPMHEIPEAARRALAGIEINALFDSDGNITGYNKKIKINDKMKALRMLGEYRKMFINKIEIGVGGDMATLIMEARQRLEKGLPAEAIPNPAIVEASFIDTAKISLADLVPDAELEGVDYL